jgi:hypothetical protein
VAADLRSLSDGLPGEAKTLQVISEHNTAVCQSLGQLLDHMRLIMILARNARIETVSVQSKQGELGNFANEISSLTAQAQRTVQNCASDHERLTGLLTTALVQQRDFMTQYRGALSALAAKLEHSLARLEERRNKSVAFTAEVAAHSRKISVAVGGAIIALQSGDSVRQRVEHSLAALRLAMDIAAQHRLPDADWSSIDGAAIAAILRCLLAAQLSETAIALKSDARQIDEALQVLVDDTAIMIDLGSSLYGGKDASSSSFLEALEGELAEASDLIHKCDAERSVVDRVTKALTSLLDQFQQTVLTLSETVRNVVLIGTNAGLQAIRAGNSGRGLVVIAQEIKSVADQITQDANRLTSTFALMQRSSAGLKEGDKRGVHELTALDQIMGQSLDHMREIGSSLAATLDRLAQDGVEFGTIVEEARLIFSTASATGDVIASAVRVLDQTPFTPSAMTQADVGIIEAFLQQHIWSTYTMAAERNIYKDVLDDCGIMSKTKAFDCHAFAPTRRRGASR